MWALNLNPTKAGVGSKYLGVSCPKALADPGVARVAPVAPILPRYSHGKYCRAFSGVNKDKLRNVWKNK